MLDTKACGGRGLVIVRADSAYYGHDVIAAARRGGARFSITARMNPAFVAAISGIDEDAWTPISYPNAIWDEAEQRLVCDAEVAEVPFIRVHLPTRRVEHDGARDLNLTHRQLPPVPVGAVGLVQRQR